MAQHFLLSAAARSLDLEQITDLSDEEAHDRFKQVRWEATDGRPVCPAEGCRCDAVYSITRECPSRSKVAGKKPIKRHTWRCKRCSKTFSVTSGTIFASHKLSFRRILRFVFFFSNNPKNITAIFLSFKVNCQYKTAWVLAQKFREAMRGVQLANAPLTGEVEIDATYTGGHIRKANLVRNRKDGRKRDRTKQKCITVMRERGPNGRSLVVVTRTDREALPFIRQYVRGPVIYADDTPTYNELSLHYDVRRIDHTNEGYAVDDRCTNWAESFFSRVKRAIKGTHHHISGPYTEEYVMEISWREDHRRVGAEQQFTAILRYGLTSPVSRKWKGYWQRRKAA